MSRDPLDCHPQVTACWVCVVSLPSFSLGIFHVWREWVCVKSPCQASAVYFNINNALLFNGALFFYTSDCVLNLSVVICSLNGKKSVLVYTKVKWICCLKSNRCVLFGWCKIALTCTHSHINSQHIFWLTETLHTRSIVTKWFYLHIKPLEYSIHETDHFLFHCSYIRPARHSLPMHSTHSYCSVVYTVTEVLYTFTAVLYTVFVVLCTPLL